MVSDVNLHPYITEVHLTEKKNPSTTGEPSTTFEGVSLPSTSDDKCEIKYTDSYEQYAWHRTYVEADEDCVVSVGMRATGGSCDWSTLRH